jgi:hypothetical protein
MDLDDRELEAQLRDALHRAAEPVHGEGVFKETVRSEVVRRQAAKTRARWTGRLVLAGAAVAAAVALFALVGTDQDQVDTDGGLPPATQPDGPSTTVEQDQDDPSVTDTPGTSDTTVATTSTTVETTTTSSAPPPPEFPPEDPLMHGKTTWGLYLLVVPVSESAADTPEFQAAMQAAQDAGYSQGDGYSGIGCDQGAREALGLDPNTEYISPAVYFASEDLANQARAAFEARGQNVTGIAHVTTYCLD